MFTQGRFLKFTFTPHLYNVDTPPWHIIYDQTKKTFPLFMPKTTIKLSRRFAETRIAKIM